MSIGPVTVDRMPFDPGPAAWNEILGQAKHYPPLAGELTADVAIIGAGFAGLSAARRLQQIDPTLQVAILEARRVAEGPAGRNSGFMIDLPHNLGSENYTAAAEDDRQRTAINRAAIAFAREAATDLSMSTEAFIESGKVNAAATQKGHDHNLTYAKHLDTLGEQHELLDETAMQQLCGSTYYKSGLFTPGTAMLQPALYIRELASGVVSSTVSLFEDSPVQTLERSGDGWHLRTPQGSVIAAQVILATNGHAESFGLFRRRLMHVYLYASMTAALDDGQVNNLGGEDRWAFTPADPMGTTVRRMSGTSGTRVVVRNSFTWAPNRTDKPKRLQEIAHIHDKSFADRFPQLAGIDMEYRWGGLLCLSRNASPAFGKIDDGLYSACCQNGLGTAMGTATGMAIAELVLDQPSSIADYLSTLPPPSKLPPEPFASIGAKVVMGWRERLAGREL